VSALVPVLGDREGVAAFLVVERPDLLEASVEAQAAALGVGVGDVRGLWRDAEFRTWVDRLLTWRVLEPAVRVGQLRKLVDISLNGERDGDAIKAFDVLSRQAGLRWLIRVRLRTVRGLRSALSTFLVGRVGLFQGMRLWLLVGDARRWARWSSGRWQVRWQEHRLGRLTRVRLLSRVGVGPRLGRSD